MNFKLFNVFVVVVAASLFVTVIASAETTRNEYRDGDNWIIVYRKHSAYLPTGNSSYTRSEDKRFEKIRNEKTGEIKYKAWEQIIDHVWKERGEIMRSEKSDLYIGKEKQAFDDMEKSFDAIVRREVQIEEEYSRGERI